MTGPRVWRRAIVTVPLIVLLGFASGRLAGSGEENAWYARLAKPAEMPPGWAFGAAWTLLYILLGLALAMILAAPRSRLRTAALTAFCIQMAVNLAWSPLFFAAHQVTAALWLIVVLTLLVAFATWRFFQVRTLAGALMLPYLAWLIFASALNFSIDRLNPDAETLAPGGDRTQISL
jgi:translocator protein